MVVARWLMVAMLSMGALIADIPVQARTEKDKDPFDGRLLIRLRSLLQPEQAAYLRARLADATAGRWF